MKLHSTTGLISNSSTSIVFVATSSSVDKAKYLVQQIMDTIGVNGDPEQYFKFELVPNDYFHDSFWDTCSEELSVELEDGTWLDPAEDAVYDRMDEICNQYIADGIYTDDAGYPYFDLNVIAIAQPPDLSNDKEAVSNLAWTMYSVFEVSEAAS